jgi:hypothetical protein
VYGVISSVDSSVITSSALRERAIMSEAIHVLSTTVRSAAGVEYVARVYGEQRGDGTWWAWLEFHPRSGSAAALRTGQETSQPDRAAVEYWAGGLEPVYLEGALARAHPLIPRQ